MSEEEKAIRWLKNNTKNYILSSEDLHYILILFNLITNLKLENQKYKKVINKIKSTCDKVPNDWTLCGIEIVNKIENILKEVEND